MGFSLSSTYAFVKVFLNILFQPKQCDPTASEEVVYVTLPFQDKCQSKCNQISRQMLSSILRFIKMNPFKTNAIFQFKDCTLVDLCSSVVYTSLPVLATRQGPLGALLSKYILTSLSVISLAGRVVDCTHLPTQL